MIFISKYIVPKGFVGITLYPFIFFNREDLKECKEIVNHEKIHLKQQKELFVVFFFIFYVVEWICKFIKYRNKVVAYRNISFEREAYLNEGDFLYLKKRKRWSFVRYI